VNFPVFQRAEPDAYSRSKIALIIVAPRLRLL